MRFIFLLIRKKQKQKKNKQTKTKTKCPPTLFHSSYILVKHSTLGLSITLVPSGSVAPLYCNAYISK